jgi:iron(III) transport system substrate-binding protein
MIKAAKEEGRLLIYAPTSIRQAGFDELVAAFKKMYGLKIRTTYVQSGSMTRDTGKLITEIATGNPPSWDVHVMIEPFHFIQRKANANEPFDYAGVLGVDPKRIQPGGAALIITEQTSMPAYNTKRVAPKDVPKTWEDLLDPKWKGKIGVNTATHHWARLSQVWGDEKTTDFVTRLAAQKPMLGRSPAIPQKVQMGEILIAATAQISFVMRARKVGAPLDWAKKVDPVILVDYAVSVPTGSRRPNGARLFASFLTTDVGQGIFERRTNISSVSKPGTLAYEYSHGKQLVRLTREFAPKMRERQNKYGKILGFR